MIINQLIFKAKPGQAAAIAEITIAEIKRFNSPLLGHWRVSVSSYGVMGQVSMQLEFDDVEACEQFWPAWLAEPSTPAHLKQLDSLTEFGGTNEIWPIIDQS